MPPPTAAAAWSIVADSAATRHRKAIGIETVSLSMTSTRKPSTDLAPIRAASAVAESDRAMWMDLHPSWSFARRVYIAAKSPGDGAEVVVSLGLVARRAKN